MEQLIQILLTGYSYTAMDNDGNAITMHSPPNKYMISAGRALKQIITSNQRLQIAHDQAHVTITGLMHDCEKYRETIKQLESKIAETKV